MDDQYSQPKDAVQMAWGSGPKSALHTNCYSDEDDDDDDRYSKPFDVANEQNSTAKAVRPDSEIFYELSDGGADGDDDEEDDYGIPPPRVEAQYNRLNAKAAGKESPAHAFNHTWQDQKAGGEPKVSPNRERAVRRVSPVGKEKKPSPVRRRDHNSSPEGSSQGQGLQQAQPQNGSSRTSPPTNPPDSSGQKRFNRQRVLYPRKGSGGSELPNAEPLVPSAPALYEEAWDTPQQKKKLEERMLIARSISATSEHFEDAMEYLPPEEWVPTSMQKADGSRKAESSTSAGSSRAVSGRTKTVDPVSGGAYEQAWDLNKGLEEKLRSIQMMQPSDAGDGEESAYQDPWDTPQKQRELEERIQQARISASVTTKGSSSGSSSSSVGKVSGGGGSTSSVSKVSSGDVEKRTHGHSSQNRIQRTAQRGNGGGGGGDGAYEDAWDTRQSLSKILQSSQSSNDGESTASSSRYGQFGQFGEPINAIIPLQNQDWYHGNISRDDAEKILRVCKDGSYLVRDSSDRCHYTLSIKSPNQMIHIQIDQCHKPDGSMRYILGKNSRAFRTIPAMVDHYTQHAVPIHGANHMMLLYPVPCHWSGNDEYEA